MLLSNCHVKAGFYEMTPGCYGQLRLRCRQMRLLPMPLLSVE